MKDLSAPTLAEDLLLVLFQPRTGAVAAAGENILHHVLAGAVLTELTFDASVTTTTTPNGSASVEVVEGRAPSDGILRSAWDYAAHTPRALETILAAIGPALRQPLLERLVARGDIREENAKVLGLLKTTTLKDGANGRRSGLVRDVHNVLVEGMEPTLRIAALAGLIWGSGTLHQFEPEIPRSSRVGRRAEEFGRGDLGAHGATQAVARAAAAMMRLIAASLPPS